MDREAWHAAIHGVAKSWTRLTDWIDWLTDWVAFKRIRIDSTSIVCVLLAQSCLILCDSVDCSQPGSSVHGILKGRILEWVAILFSRGSSRPRNWTWVSCIAGRFFTIWATREAQYVYYNRSNRFIVLICRLQEILLSQRARCRAVPIV